MGACLISFGGTFLVDPIDFKIMRFKNETKERIIFNVNDPDWTVREEVAKRVDTFVN